MLIGLCEVLRRLLDRSLLSGVAVADGAGEGVPAAARCMNFIVSSRDDMVLGVLCPDILLIERAAECASVSDMVTKLQWHERFASCDAGTLKLMRLNRDGCTLNLGDRDNKLRSDLYDTAQAKLAWKTIKFYQRTPDTNRAVRENSRLRIPK